MTRIIYRWNFPEALPAAIKSNLDSFSRPFRSILFRRGCRTMEDAVSLLLPAKPAFPEDIGLGHVSLACELIRKAVENGRAIAVYGDYDTDGITATAVLTLALNKISHQVIHFIPNRLNDGYGLNFDSIDYLHHQGASLLITVDNGIKSISETAYAKSLGMDVIITDHHRPSDPLPDADAIINPKLPGDPYPNKNLAGVGVAYKLVCGLASLYPEIKPDEYLDLVALGTIADIVPLIGENRYLVKQGLNQINQRPRQSLLSLLGAAGLIDNVISSSDISFQIAPRINASGRLGDLGSDDHLTPLKLLLSTNKNTCGVLAQKLEIHNDRRKLISRSMQERIELQISSMDSLPAILVSLDAKNDLGVAGIAAGYLTNKYYLPAIVGAAGEEYTTASCRSIPEFDIISALSNSKDLFSRFGGHKLAAGFTIENKNIQEFLERITSLAEKELSGLDLRPSLNIDAVVTLSDFTKSFYRELIKLEPTGEGNPTPLFAVQGVTAKQVTAVGKSNDHLKMHVSDGNKNMPAIAFGMGLMRNSLPDKFDIACYFSENVFRGRKEFQLQIVDLKPSV